MKHPISFRKMPSGSHVKHLTPRAETVQKPAQGTHTTPLRAFRTGSAILLALFLAILPIFTLTGCARTPELDTVRDRFAELIEASGDINDVLWGEGLPFYDTDSEYALAHGLYDETGIQLGNYRYVTAEALEKYPTLEDIRLAARKVYSSAFLDGVETSLFEGNMISTGSVSIVSRARYAEINNTLCILSGWNQNLSYHRRVFDTSSMQIIKKLSSSDVITVSVASSLPDGSDQQTVSLRFVLENNSWMLDSPTY